MIAPITLGFVLGLQASPSGVSAGRYELAERLKRLDVAWMANRDPGRRREAIAPINSAVTAFFSMRTSDAAQAMDEAIALLEGRRVRSSDALSIRPERPFSEPGATVTLKIGWAYRPSSVIPVRVGAGRQEVDVRPGSEATLKVNPWVVNPELRQNQEVGYLLPVRAGNDTRYVYLSFVRRFDERVRRLKESQNPFVVEIAKLVEGYQSNPGTLETELPLVQFLFSAETIEDGKARFADIEQVFHARSGSTVLRGAFPKSRPDRTIDLVVAVHGAGGSENMFFESYGRGLAVSEALKRGWGFVAPRAGPTCVDDSVRWVEQARGMTIRRVFLIGHSMGGGIVLGGRYSVKPAAIAAFAPAANRLGEALSGVPLWVMVGKSDPLAMAVGALKRSLAGRADTEFQELDPCEHLMVAADGLPDAYRFFDRYAQ